jgi:VanZ family protein
VAFGSEQNVKDSNFRWRTKKHNSNMSHRGVSVWVWAAFAWIGVIFFSSTTLASRWAEASFNLLANTLISPLQRDSVSYGIIHLFADKGFHVTLFCVLAVLLWQALRHSEKKIWVILLSGAAVGSCSEFLQRFFPGRDPAIRDVLINIGGTAIGIAFCIVVTKALSHRSRVPARV